MFSGLCRWRRPAAAAAVCWACAALMAAGRTDAAGADNTETIESFPSLIELAPESPWPAAAGYVEICPPCGADSAALVPQVTARPGARVKSKALWKATGEPVKVLFDTSGGEKLYEVRLVPAPKEKPPEWTPRAGLLLETRKRIDGKVDTLEQVRELWTKSKPSLGVSPVKKIFDGVNPHGPVNDRVYRYTGFLSVDTPGEYMFATVSDDASFLLIDNSCVSQWPGWHGVGEGLRCERGGKLSLSKGVHSVEYLNVQNAAGPFCAVAAWRPPGAAAPSVIPDSAFVPLARFQVKEVVLPEIGGGAPKVSISWRTVGHSMIDGYAITSVEFKAAASVEGCAFVWRFDDNSSQTGQTVEHVFLAPGMREVKLELVRNRGVIRSARQTVSVQPMWSQTEDWHKELSARQMKEIRKRDLAVLPINDLSNLLRIVIKLDDHNRLDWLVGVCASRAAELAAADARLVFDLERALEGRELRKYALGEKILRTIIASDIKDEGVKELARLRLAELVLRWKSDHVEARALLEKLNRGKLGGDDKRLALLVEGDALSLAGEIKEARKRHTDTGVGGDPKDALRPTRVDARKCAAAQYLSLKEFDEAERLLGLVALETPMERMTPDFNLLRGRIHLERQEFDFAIFHSLLALRLAAPGSEATADALLLLARARLGKGEKDKAGEARSRLLSEFPFSAAAAASKDFFDRIPTNTP